MLIKVAVCTLTFAGWDSLFLLLLCDCWKPAWRLIFFFSCGGGVWISLTTAVLGGNAAPLRPSLSTQGPFNICADNIMSDLLTEQTKAYTGRHWTDVNTAPTILPDWFWGQTSGSWEPGAAGGGQGGLQPSGQYRLQGQPQVTLLLTLNPALIYLLIPEHWYGWIGGSADAFSLCSNSHIFFLLSFGPPPLTHPGLVMYE